MPPPMGPTNQGPIKINVSFDPLNSQRIGVALNSKTYRVAHVYAQLTIHTSSFAYQRMDDHTNKWMIVPTIAYIESHNHLYILHTCPYIVITCTPHLKTLLHVHIFPIWKEKS